MPTTNPTATTESMVEQMTECKGQAMKFVKRPVVIEAMQLNSETLWDVASWCDGLVMGPAAILIVTLEGEMRAQCGDWIIKGVQGEFYPCKPDIFEATYEPAPPEAGK